MKVVVKSSENKEVLDITDTVAEQVRDHVWRKGAVLVFTKHTTCAVTTSDLDPGTDKDILDAIQKIFPKGNYRHQHDPSHVGDHIMSSLINSSVTIPIKKGELQLGTWQRIVLIELNGPKDREIVLTHLQGE